MNSIKIVWNGEASLIFTYWVIGVLGNLIMSFIALTLESMGPVYNDSAAFGIFALFFFIFMLSYLVFSQVAIWRSAGNYIADAKSEHIVKSSSPFWGYVARIMVALAGVQIIWAIFDEFTRY